MKRFIMVLAVVLLTTGRFLLVDSLPPGLSNDEIEYAVNAKSYAINGRDLSGNGIPKSLFISKTDGEISPIPPFLISFPLKFVPLTQSTIRIIANFVNILTALALYVLMITIFGKKSLGLIAAVLFLLNPWSIYFSTQIYEPPFALLFYILAIATLIKCKRWGLVLPFALFVLAFFSYHGGKFIFLPVIVITLIYKYFSEKTDLPKLKNYLVFLASSLIFVGLYFLISKSIPGATLFSRSNELIFNDTNYSAIVNEERRQSIYTPFNNLLINKPTEIIKVFTRQYLAAFSPDVLFTRGDTRALYRFENHGLFYLIDLPLIILGLAGMYSKKRREFWLISGLTVVAPLATAVSRIETSVINRSFLLLPLLVVYSSFGVMELIDLFKNKILRKTVIAFIGIILGLFVAYFYHFFIFRLPVTGQEKYWLGEKVLNQYLTYNSNQNKVIFITDKPRTSFLRFIFFSNDTVQKINLKNTIPFNENVSSYQLGNLVFTNVCPQKLNSETIYAIKTNTDCKPVQKPDFAITDQKDAGTLIDIYNSSICKDVSELNWRRYNTFDLYSIEKLDYSSFCSNWIFIP